MGRNRSEVLTTSKSRSLNIGWMLRNKFIEKNKVVKGTVEWMDGSTAKFISSLTANEKYLKVNYTITRRNGKTIPYNYVIQLVTVPSNLGKGELLYFECPESGKRARILYSAYDQGKYAHRDWYLEEYGKRLYYNSQLCSKNNYHNKRYHTLNSKINDLLNDLYHSKNRKMHYRGKPTKNHQRLNVLGLKRLYHNNKRTSILADRLSKYFPDGLSL